VPAAPCGDSPELGAGRVLAVAGNNDRAPPAQRILLVGPQRHRCSRSNQDIAGE